MTKLEVLQNISTTVKSPPHANIIALHHCKHTPNVPLVVTKHSTDTEQP